VKAVDGRMEAGHEKEGGHSSKRDGLKVCGKTHERLFPATANFSKIGKGAGYEEEE
jgi:hypothetical protein